MDLMLNMEFITPVKQDFYIFSIVVCTCENIKDPVSLVKDKPLKILYLQYNVGVRHFFWFWDIIKQILYD